MLHVETTLHVTDVRVESDVTNPRQSDLPRQTDVLDVKDLRQHNEPLLTPFPLLSWMRHVRRESRTLESAGVFMLPCVSSEASKTPLDNAASEGAVQRRRRLLRTSCAQVTARLGTARVRMRRLSGYPVGLHWTYQGNVSMSRVWT